MSRHFALLPAAGQGSRLGAARPKQYLELHGHPLLWHAVRCFCTHPAITRTFVVLSPGDAYFARVDWSEFGERLQPLYCGGESRAHSVCNALEAVVGDIDGRDWVLVHDGARPCISHRLIDCLLDALTPQEVGALLALPVADTLKREDGAGRARSTEPRAGLWQAQTPQAFRHGELLQALRQGLDAALTDEASAFERLGMHPRLVPGSALNLKVTHGPDLELARAILARSESAP